MSSDEDLPLGKNAQESKNLELEKEENIYFPYDPEITDFTLVVQGEKFHVAKVVLMDASTVFRKMLTSDFKENNANELELPEKDKSTFEFFLRCIYPRECTLTESLVWQTLSLADEYDAKSVIHRCEDWLIFWVELREAREGYVNYKYAAYLVKCLYYGEKYDMNRMNDTLYRMLKNVKFHQYDNSEHYKLLSEKSKITLLEARLRIVDR